MRILEGPRVHIHLTLQKGRTYLFSKAEVYGYIMSLCKIKIGLYNNMQNKNLLTLISCFTLPEFHILLDSDSNQCDIFS